MDSAFHGRSAGGSRGSQGRGSRGWTGLGRGRGVSGGHHGHCGGRACCERSLKCSEPSRPSAFLVPRVPALLHHLSGSPLSALRSPEECYRATAFCPWWPSDPEHGIRLPLRTEAGRRAEGTFKPERNSVLLTGEAGQDGQWPRATQRDEETHGGGVGSRARSPGWVGKPFMVPGSEPARQVLSPVLSHCPLSSNLFEGVSQVPSRGPKFVG